MGGGVAADSAARDGQRIAAERATAASSTPATTRGDHERDRGKAGAAKDTSGTVDSSETKSAPLGSRQEAEQAHDVWAGSAQEVQRAPWQLMLNLWVLLQKLAPIAWVLSWFTKE